jgi:tetratricopeptide (TPR) repeat protein
MRQKDYQKAFPLISQVVKENPQAVLPQFHLAQVYYLFSNYVESKNILLKLEAIVPEQMDVKKWIAQSSYYLKDFANAKIYFEEGIRQTYDYFLKTYEL